MFEKYSQYNFNQNKQWRDFISKIFPLPDQEKMEQIKRNWYKLNVDNEFDINVGLQKKEPVVQKSKLDEKGYIFSFFYHIENYSKMSFLASPMFFRSFAYYLAFFINVLGILRQIKANSNKNGFLQFLLHNEFFQNMIYLLTVLYFPQMRGIIFLIPLFLHYWLGVCEYLKIKGGKFYENGKIYIEKTTQNRNKMKSIKAKAEIYIVLYYFVRFIIQDEDQISYLYLIIINLGFMMFKYIFNDISYIAINEFTGGKILKIILKFKKKSSDKID